MGLRPLEIFLILQCGDRLQSSESDVYRRQILTTKVDPRAVRVQQGLNLLGHHSQLLPLDTLGHPCSAHAIKSASYRSNYEVRKAPDIVNWDELILTNERLT